MSTTYSFHQSLFYYQYSCELCQLPTWTAKANNYYMCLCSPRSQDNATLLGMATGRPRAVPPLPPLTPEGRQPSPDPGGTISYPSLPVPVSALMCSSEGILEAGSMCLKMKISGALFLLLYRHDWFLFGPTTQNMAS